MSTPIAKQHAQCYTVLMIYGNTEGIKRAVLWQLKDLETDYDKNLFVDRDVLALMAELTSRYNREFSVFITRGGRIVGFGIGDCSTVKLPDLSQKRGKKGLNGIRCIHTHPNASGELSAPDVSALKAAKYDCMAAVGVTDKRVTDLYAAFLEGDSVVCLRYKGADFDDDRLMDRITEAEHSTKGAAVAQDVAPNHRALLIHCSQAKDAQSSLSELSALAATLDYEPVYSVIQRKDRPDKEFFVGSGKLKELSLICQVNRIATVIFDHQLSSLQVAKIEEELGLTVIDRPTLILDIFAKHATTAEGKLQVELAALKHLLPTLSGQGKALSRQRGGLYAMGGGGETKLELDRRHIYDRINLITDKLEKVKQRQDERRNKRREKGVKNVVIVGYTNAGKSTLMNRITKAGVLEENKLFATLDSVSRNVWQDRGEYLLTDTVGFINRLPHEFVDAFKSTLDETRYADLLLLVADASESELSAKYDVVIKVLEEIGAGAIPRITVYNKCDAQKEEIILPVALDSVRISAKTGEGIEELRALIVEKLFPVDNQ